MMAGSISDRVAAILSVDILFEKLGHAVEHGGQRAGGFADLDHVDGQRGNSLDCLSEPESGWPSRTLFAGGFHRALEQRRAQRDRRRFPWPAPAGCRPPAECSKCAPAAPPGISTRFRRAMAVRSFDLVDFFAGPNRAAPTSGTERCRPPTPPQKHDILLRRRADGDQVHGHDRQLRLHAAVKVGEGGHHVGHQEDHQQDHQARSARTGTSAKP